MYEKAGMCKSQCSECGVACEAPRLTSIASVDRFARLKCDVVLGTLDLSSLQSVPESVIHTAFAHVTKIQGDLIIRNLPDLVSLGFLSNLRQVNSIVIENCVNLVDARLPALVSRDSVTITHCPRLCDARKPTANTNTSTVWCAAAQLEQYFELRGTASVLPMNEIAAKLTEALNSVADSNLQVNAHVMLGWHR